MQPMPKPCPRCGNPLVCRADSIAECPCFTLTRALSEAEISFIARQYTDCLCVDCLRTMQQEYEKTITP